MVVFLAAFQGIDETYYEAAKIDGANGLQQMWHVTLAFVRRPSTTLVLLAACRRETIFPQAGLMVNWCPA